MGYLANIRKCRGAAFVEFALGLPVIIIIVAGIIDVGSFFYQMELASDAIRYGAREAARSSFDADAECSSLKQMADQHTTDYMTNTLKISTQKWALYDGGSRICRLQGPDMSQPVAVIQQKVSILSTVLSTCVFCWLGNFSSVKPVLSYYELLPEPCCFSGVCDYSSIPEC